MKISLVRVLLLLAVGTYVAITGQLHNTPKPTLFLISVLSGAVLGATFAVIDIMKKIDEEGK